MPGTTPSYSKWSLFAWISWWLALGLLTYGLVSPDPANVATDVLTGDTRMLVSKSIHVGAYGSLAFFAGWLLANRGSRIGLWLLLVGHGALTEYIQTFVDGRSGTISDVVIDCIGITLGALLVQALRRWRSTLPEAPASSAPAISTSAPHRPPE